MAKTDVKDTEEKIETKTETKSETKTEAKKTKEKKYEKLQLYSSVRYSKYKDLINAVLKDDKTYTVSEVDKIIECFLSKEVG
jgi:hypothetical protein